eukprot:COSAG01_NODE_910_length_12784_cov_15.136460_7_plen_86_part_00
MLVISVAMSYLDAFTCSCSTVMMCTATNPAHTSLDNSMAEIITPAPAPQEDPPPHAPHRHQRSPKAVANGLPYEGAASRVDGLRR